MENSAGSDSSSPARVSEINSSTSHIPHPAPVDDDSSDERTFSQPDATSGGEDVATRPSDHGKETAAVDYGDTLTAPLRSTS